MTNQVHIGHIPIGAGAPLALIAGPCVLENTDLCLEIAAGIAAAAAEVGMPWVFKGSYDKANRTSVESYRGPGLEQGLAMLAYVKEAFGVPVETDVHETCQVAAVAQIADVIQIPAFLCRQTDLIVAAAQTGKAVMVKKGQFMAPEDMAQAKQKVLACGNENILLCERGTSFGYHRLTVDMRSLEIMRSLGCPVVLDATHSVMLPAGAGNVSGGERQFVPALCRAGAAVGIDALFLEVHPRPTEARSDAATSWPLADLADLLRQVKAIDACQRRLIG
jgi:2-dehydro-3-deoxyphosphooctonate aldolase (KDO 8-P synthase)